MSRVFVYWDNSNIFIGARDVAEEREGRSARHRVRIDFKAMMRLAHADRPVEKAIAAGSVPPELRALWNRLEAAGVQVELFDRGAVERGEQQAPDRVLQLQMLCDFNVSPTGGPVLWRSSSRPHGVGAICHYRDSPGFAGSRALLRPCRISSWSLRHSGVPSCGAIRWYPAGNDSSSFSATSIRYRLTSSKLRFVGMTTTGIGGLGVWNSMFTSPVTIASKPSPCASDCSFPLVAPAHPKARACSNLCSGLIPPRTLPTRSGRHSSTNTLTGQGQGGRLVPDAPERTPARVP